MLRSSAVTAAILAGLVCGACASAPSQQALSAVSKDREACYLTGKLRHFGQDLGGLNKAACDELSDYTASELDRWYAGGPVGGSSFSYTFIAK
jgi:hypothetical protein